MRYLRTFLFSFFAGALSGIWAQTSQQSSLHPSFASPEVFSWKPPVQSLWGSWQQRSAKSYSIKDFFSKDRQFTSAILTPVAPSGNRFLTALPDNAFQAQIIEKNGLYMLGSFVSQGIISTLLGIPIIAEGPHTLRRR